MKIGLDYGGVISFAPDSWKESIKKAITKGHQIYIISHAQPGADAELRAEFAKTCGAVNLTFWDLKSGSQENEIANRKADICKMVGIEIFIDDDLDRAATVGNKCRRCAALYVPQSLWQIGQRIVNDLEKDQ